MTAESFGDIPLFREIQKILSSSSGPINTEIARQVGIAIATQGTPDPEPSVEDARAYAEQARVTEELVAGYTRLEIGEPVRTEAIARGRWVELTLDGWMWLLGSLARRFSAQMTELPAQESAAGMGAMMQQIGPLLIGLQAGTLVGHLATEAIGPFDPPIPRDDDGHLRFVDRNAMDLAREYNFDRDEFRRWVAAHDVTRNLVLQSAPWITRYFRSLFVEVIDAMEIDMGSLEQRLVELQSSGMEGLESAAGIDPAIPIAETERHRAALDRLRAFMAALEGYATHTSTAIAEAAGGGSASIDEGIRRRNASPSEARNMLSSILGISFDRELETSGATFCAAVVKLKGLTSLNQMWTAPDNLPGLDEIKDPFLWMERVTE
ncbi:MAG: zinc-dependent metalloprotease [Actinomycetota bacterium]